LAPSRQRPRDRRGRSFGFSWRVAVSLRRPLITRVGFPWISLDSLVRIETYQWVTRLLARRISRAWVPDVSSPTTAGLALGMRKGMVAHGLKLTVISDFLQAIVFSDCCPSPFERRSKATRQKQLALSWVSLAGHRKGVRALTFFRSKCDADHSGRLGMALTLIYELEGIAS
jgi:hypothetical protein